MTNYVDRLFKNWAVERYGAAVIDKISDSEIESVRCLTMRYASTVAASYIATGKSYAKYKKDFSVKEYFLESLKTIYHDKF